VYATGYDTQSFLFGTNLPYNRSCCYSQNTSLIYPPQSFFQAFFSGGASIQMWVGSKRNLSPLLIIRISRDHATGSCFLRAAQMCGILPIFTMNLFCLMIEFSLTPQAVHRLESKLVTSTRDVGTRTRNSGSALPSPSRVHDAQTTPPDTWASKQARSTIPS